MAKIPKSLSNKLLGIDIKPVLNGLYKAIVEDVRDPFGMGRIRARCVSLHGDASMTPTLDLPWCTPIWAVKGNFSPPELFDRVWLLFEQGDLNNPLWFGYWNAIPIGKGKLPQDKRDGSEVPLRGWGHYNDLYPEMHIVASTSEGSSIYMLDKVVGETYFGETGIKGAGTGGQKTVFYKHGVSDYASKKSVITQEDLRKYPDQNPVNKLPWKNQKFSSAYITTLHDHVSIVREIPDLDVVVKQDIHSTATGGLKSAVLSLNNLVQSTVMMVGGKPIMNSTVAGVSVNSENIKAPGSRWMD